MLSPGRHSSTLPIEEAHTWRRLVARFKRSGVFEERLKRLERALGVKSVREESRDESHD